MQRFVYIQTFGCQMNVYDTERIIQVLGPKGYAPTEDPSKADLILLNSCTVRDKAEQKIMSCLGTFAPLKQHNPDLILGIGGCLAQQEGEALLKKAKILDLVFGPDNIQSLPSLIDAVIERGQRVSETTLHKTKGGYEFVAGEPVFDGKPSAMVTVMKGCNKNCSFCIVPQVRGRELSKPWQDVVSEVERFVASGVKEILLLGQNVNSYGHDRDDGVVFAELLDKVDAVAGLERLRFTTSHPWDCTDALISRFDGRLKTLCEFFHLPVQSGSDRILEAMRRGYTVAEYIERADALRRTSPDLFLSTDIIVGFPGETEEDFQGTLALIERVGYEHLYAFKYSPRPGTKAATLPDDVPESVKTDRLAQVLDANDRCRTARLATYLGKTVEILVEGQARGGRVAASQMTGRTRNNTVVNFPVPNLPLGIMRFTGQLARIHITKTYQHSLLGEIEQIAENPTRTMVQASLQLETLPG